MSVELVQVCSSWTADGSCAAVAWQAAYLLPESAGEQLDLLLQGGFSSDLFRIGFLGTLGCFVTGFCIGLIVSQLRKLKVR